MKVYVVLNEGNMVFASEDSEIAHGMADSLNDVGIEDEVEDSGRDIDDLTDEELAEFAFSNGFNGGYYECIELNLDADNIMELDGNSTEVALDDEDTTVTYSEIFEMLLSSSEDDEIFEDIEDDEDISEDFSDYFDDDIDFGEVDN